VLFCIENSSLSLKRRGSLLNRLQPDREHRTRLLLKWMKHNEWITGDKQIADDDDVQS
jgi:hypothetical protein